MTGRRRVGAPILVILAVASCTTGQEGSDPRIDNGLISTFIGNFGGYDRQADSQQAAIRNAQATSQSLSVQEQERQTALAQSERTLAELRHDVDVQSQRLALLRRELAKARARRGQDAAALAQVQKGLDEAQVRARALQTDSGESGTSEAELKRRLQELSADADLYQNMLGL